MACAAQDEGDAAFLAFTCLVRLTSKGHQQGSLLADGTVSADLAFQRSQAVSLELYKKTFSKVSARRQ